MPDYTYIDRQQSFDLACSLLDRAASIAVDTESSGYYTYYSKICLIQISTDSQHFIIDPLAGLDLKHLARIFADQKIEKIFHAATSDMGELRRHYGWSFAGVFDTHLAARYLKHEACSLLALVQKYAGVQLEKKEQKSNWMKRPLTKAQLDYAHLDTVYLHRIRERMEEELQRAGLFEEFQSEMEWICENDEADHEKLKHPNAWMRVHGALRLSAASRGRFAAVYALREDRAKKENIAAFRLLSNRNLFRLVEELPQTIDALQDFGLHPVFLQRDGNRIITALRDAAPLDKLPDDERQIDPPDVEERFHRLKEWRQKTASRRKLEVALILPNRVLKEIARKQPAAIDDLKALRLMSEWKLQNYGPAIVKLAGGQ
jgi:ribonuclease D